MNGWLLWLAWGAYCVPVAPTWCYVWIGLRESDHGRLISWLTASVLAVLWLPFLWQHRRWLRRQVPETVADEAARYLAGVRANPRT